MVNVPIACDREADGCNQERRVEGADVDQRRDDRLEQEQRDEQVQPGAGAQLGQLAPRDVPGPRSKLGRVMVI